MGRVAFVEENVKSTNLYDFPKLKLKKGEKARIVLLEEPWSEYVHNLRKPVVVDGVPVTEMRTRAKGDPVEDYKYAFVSNPICLGDPGVLNEKGSDPVNCPMCAEAKVADRVAAPKRRFAMHVLKYTTKPGTHDIATPYQASVVIWAFTDKIFGKLFGYQKEWGNLKEHDLLLVCDNEPFQNYELSVAQKAGWTETPEIQRLSVEIFRSNQAPEIAAYCGYKKEPRYVELDLADIREAWGLVKQYKDGSTVDPNSGIVTTSLNEGLDDLLNTTSTPKKAEEQWTPTETAAPTIGTDPGGDDFDSLLGTSAPSAPAEAEKKADAPKADDFDDLLAGLN